VKPAENSAANNNESPKKLEPVLSPPPPGISYRPPELEQFRKAQSERIKSLLDFFQDGGVPEELLESRVFRELVEAHPGRTDPTWSLAIRWIDRHREVDDAIRLAFSHRKIQGLDPVIELCRLCLTETLQYATAYRIDAEYRTALADMAEPDSMYLRPRMATYNRAPVAFQLLMFIYAHQRRYDDAMEVCRVAEREGWQGDWNERIARLEAMKWRDARCDPAR
jgi:hypothetical protein